MSEADKHNFGLYIDLESVYRRSDHTELLKTPSGRQVWVEAVDTMVCFSSFEHPNMVYVQLEVVDDYDNGLRLFVPDFLTYEPPYTENPKKHPDLYAKKLIDLMVPYLMNRSKRIDGVAFDWSANILDDTSGERTIQSVNFTTYISERNKALEKYLVDGLSFNQSEGLATKIALYQTWTAKNLALPNGFTIPSKINESRNSNGEITRVSGMLLSENANQFLKGNPYS